MATTKNFKNNFLIGSNSLILIITLITNPNQLNVSGVVNDLQIMVALKSMAIGKYVIYPTMKTTIKHPRI